MLFNHSYSVKKNRTASGHEAGAVPFLIVLDIFYFSKALSYVLSD